MSLPASSFKDAPTLSASSNADGLGSLSQTLDDSLHKEEGDYELNSKSPTSKDAGYPDKMEKCQLSYVLVNELPRKAHVSEEPRPILVTYKFSVKDLLPALKMGNLLGRRSSADFNDYVKTNKPASSAVLQTSNEPLARGTPRVWAI